MRLALSLFLLAATASAQGRVTDRACDIASRRSDRGGVACSPAAAYAQFEFAPASGAGMGAACAGNTPTGAKGEVMTFTRASSATCDKSNGLTSIQPGDLVTLTDDQPRVSTVGTSTKKLGLHEARTNNALRSEAIDNVAWIKEAGVTVSANSMSCPLAPDGAQTMNLVAFNAATTGGIYSSLSATLNTTLTHSVYVARKTGGAACTLLLADGYTAGVGTTLIVPASGANRMVFTKTITGTVNSPYLHLTTVGDCVDVCVWGMQTEQPAVAAVGPYIPTAGAAVTRAAEVAYVTLPVAPKSTGVFSAAATITTSRLSSETWTGWILSTAGAAPYAAFYSTGTNGYCDSSNGTSITATRASVGSFSDTRVVCWNDGSNEQGIYGGVAFATPAAGTRTAPSALRLYIGNSFTAGVQINGWISNQCFDPSSTRCR